MGCFESHHYSGLGWVHSIEKNFQKFLICSIVCHRLCKGVKYKGLASQFNSGNCLNWVRYLLENRKDSIWSAVLTCSICGGESFSDWRGRPDEQCDQCGALARHRVAMAIYQRHLFSLKGEGWPLRVLHLAPEPGLHPLLSREIGVGYICADASPERYPHAECLKLFFPNDFKIFPDSYFDAILHNHVLEHIPGHYRDHLIAFTRLLKPGGRMIFSVPGPYLGRQTIEGGENLASDAERLEKFLQEDHFKLFGADFVSFISEIPGGHAVADGVTDKIRASLNVRPNKAPFFIWEKEA